MELPEATSHDEYRHFNNNNYYFDDPASPAPCQQNSYPSPSFCRGCTQRKNVRLARFLKRLRELRKAQDATATDGAI